MGYKICVYETCLKSTEEDSATYTLDKGFLAACW